MANNDANYLENISLLIPQLLIGIYTFYGNWSTEFFRKEVSMEPPQYNGGCFGPSKAIVSCHYKSPRRE
jgi:hypothetical protein